MRKTNLRRNLLKALVVAAALGTLLTVTLFMVKKDRATALDGQRMLATIKQQLDYGPRYLGAPGHEKLRQFLVAKMQKQSDKTVTQLWEYTGQDGKKYQLTNIIGRTKPTNEKRIILASHYDSKRFADKDPFHKDQPVPGANDSASGVAVLLELAHMLHDNPAQPDIGIDFVFFDGEEGDISLSGDYIKWEPLGSTYFARHLDVLYDEAKPLSALVIDMVCDKELTIYKEHSSIQNAPALVDAFWSVAEETDGNVFRSQAKYHILDDHTPLNQAGIPSILLIDFDYPHFHTTEDTPDKCSADSLKTVASVVLKYLHSLN